MKTEREGLTANSWLITAGDETGGNVMTLGIKGTSNVLGNIVLYT